MIDLNTSEQELYKRLNSATEVVRAMHLTEQNKALLAMLDAMASIYTLELIREDSGKRDVIRQILQMRRVIAGEDHLSVMI